MLLTWSIVILLFSRQFSVALSAKCPGRFNRKLLDFLSGKVGSSAVQPDLPGHLVSCSLSPAAAAAAHRVKGNGVQGFLRFLHSAGMPKPSSKSMVYSVRMGELFSLFFLLLRATTKLPQIRHNTKNSDFSRDFPFLSIMLLRPKFNSVFSQFFLSTQ